MCLDDLRQTPRLLELYRQAAAEGKVRDSDYDRLEFVALAEHARAHGSDPSALFAWLLARGARDRITLTDEDAARDRIRAWREREVEELGSRGGLSATALGKSPGRPEPVPAGLGGLPRAPEGPGSRSAVEPRQEGARAPLARRPHGRQGQPEAVGSLIASSLYWAQRRLEERRAVLGVGR